jgi:magnesium transporter
MTKMLANHAQRAGKSQRNWNVLIFVKKMRIQAEIFLEFIRFMVDDEDRKGRLSFKDLLTTSSRTANNDVDIKKLNFKVDTEDVEWPESCKIRSRSHSVVDELGGW